jgi:hypothetical protein
MTFQGALDAARKQIRKRKANRDRKRARHQGPKARREARAVRTLRRRVRHLLAIVSAPRVMFDSVTVSGLPADAPAVAGYVNGLYANVAELARRFPKRRRKTIAVTASVDAHVLDIETGDATPDEAPGWVARHDHKKYGTPILYTMASQVEAVEDAMGAAGYKRSEYHIWSAHVGAGKHLCGPKSCGYGHTKAEGTQWDWREQWDESVLRPAFWS